MGFRERVTAAAVVIVVIRKLKRRFIIVNMSILTCLMLGVQVAVFTMM